MNADGYDDTVAELGSRLRSGAVSAVELVDEFSSRIAAEDSDVHSVRVMFASAAREQARARDAELRAGDVRGPLHGIPILLKDNILSRESTTHAGSSAPLSSASTVRDARVVEALREAGAVILGKTRMSELAIGIPTGSAAWREPMTPQNGNAWAGGSSSGSAAAVACGFAPIALGSDTGGSIRIPAAFCAVTGFKPSWGTLSTDGVVPLAPTLDTVGPLARTAQDCRLLLAALVGGRGFDGDPRMSLAGMRIALDPLSDRWGGGMDDLWADRLDAVADALRDLGATVVERTLPMFDELSDATLIVLLAEAIDCHAEDLRLHWEEFGEPSRHRVLSGAVVDENTRTAAERVRARAMAEIATMFQDVDVALSPTSGLEPPLISELSRGRIDGLRLLYTRYWNATRCPVLAVPVGTGTHGRPLGIQIAAREGADTLCLDVGEALQRHTDWHRTPTDTARYAAQSAGVDSAESTPDVGREHLTTARNLRQRGFPVLDDEAPRLARHIEDLQASIDRLTTALGSEKREEGIG